jgi:hypothetical protein
MIRAAIILGVLAILAAALAGGRYSLTQQGNMAFEVDRYTGTVWFYTRDGCSKVRGAEWVVRSRGIGGRDKEMKCVIVLRLQAAIICALTLLVATVAIPSTCRALA